MGVIILLVIVFWILLEVHGTLGQKSINIPSDLSLHQLHSKKQRSHAMYNGLIGFIFLEIIALLFSFLIVIAIGFIFILLGEFVIYWQHPYSFKEHSMQIAFASVAWAMRSLYLSIPLAVVAHVYIFDKYFFLRMKEDE